MKDFFKFFLVGVLCFSSACQDNLNSGIQDETPDEQPAEQEKPDEPQIPDEPSEKGKSVKFSIGITGSNMTWAEDDKVRIFSVSTNADGLKILKSAQYNIMPDKDNPSKAAVAVQPGALDLRWLNDDEHVFYAVFSKNDVLSVKKDGTAEMPFDSNQRLVLADDGSGNYTGVTDMDSYYLSATVSCDPQDIVGDESVDGCVFLDFSPLMKEMNIVIEGPSNGEAVLTAVSITAETASEEAWAHKFSYDMNDGVVTGPQTASGGNNARQVSTLLSFVNDDSENPNSIRLVSGKTLKITALLPPIGADANRSLTVRPHTAGSAAPQLVHKVDFGKLASGSCTVTLSFDNQADAVSSNSWMTYIDDNVYVSQLSIPGTHDAATEKLSVGQCQNLSVEEQLDMGIRMFDLRPTVTSDGLGNIYHSILDTKVSMNDVMTWFGSFLDENPDEFIMAVMRWESERGGSEADYKKYMTEFLGGNSVYQARKLAFRQDLTLGECRGKILLISRTDLSPNNLYETAYTGWNHGNTIRAPHDIRGTGGGGKIRVQDMYSKSENGNSSENDYLAKKRELVKGMMDISAQYRTSGSYEWMISHCSGYTGSSWSPDYKNNAANVHPEIYSYLTGTDKEVGPTGIIMMDFAGSRKAGADVIYGDLLPQAIIDNNFRFPMKYKTL